MVHSRFSPALLLCSCLLVSGSGVQARRSFQKPYYSEAGRAGWGERNRKFGRLWLSRWQSPEKAAREILPFATQKVDANADLRERAVVALGRIESPVAQEPLEALLRDETQYIQALIRQNTQRPRTPYRALSPECRVSIGTLKFALARIKSRHLEGEAKLNFVAKSVGTTWPAVREQGRLWKRKMSAPSQRMAVYDYLHEIGSPRLSLEEFAQLLHDMGRKGENVNALGASDLLVWPSEKTTTAALYDHSQTVILTANMPRQQAIDFWLKRALPTKEDGTLLPGSFSPQAFLDLGPSAVAELKVALRELLVRTKNIPRLGDGAGAIGPRTLFEAAAASGDREFIPILQSFKNTSFGYYAKQSLTRLESGEGATILPCSREIFSFG